MKSIRGATKSSERRGGGGRTTPARPYVWVDAGCSVEAGGGGGGGEGGTFGCSFSGGFRHGPGRPVPPGRAPTAPPRAGAPPQVLPRRRHPGGGRKPLPADFS